MHPGFVLRGQDEKMIAAKEEGVLSRSVSLETIHSSHSKSHSRATWKRMSWQREGGGRGPVCIEVHTGRRGEPGRLVVSSGAASSEFEWKGWWSPEVWHVDRGG